MHQEAPPPPHLPWPFGVPLLFRWWCVYLVMYLVGSALSIVPGGALVLQLTHPTWRALVNWTSERVFDHVVTIWPNGSGDTTYNYVEVFVMAAIATAVALVWTACTMRHRSYPWLLDLSRIYVRFALGSILVGYGFAKVFPGQFSSPEVPRLMQAYGDSSPMGLLWTFMGASTAYTIIAGASEVIAGTLLFFRRTTLIGSLLAAGVMANVVALNFCYDVPVKLFSSHLLLAALFLAAPDLPRLANVLLLNRRVPPAEIGPPWRTPWIRWVLFGVKMLVVISVLGFGGYGGYVNASQWGPWAPRQPLAGTWVTTSFTQAGVQHPPLTTDEVRWKYITIGISPMFSMAGVMPMSGQQAQYHQLKVIPSSDPQAGMLELSVGGAPREPGGVAPEPLARLEYWLLPNDVLKLEGTYHGALIAVTLKKKNPEEFLLVKRGFHWINEFPFNR